MVAIDPGKVMNRVWLASGERGMIGEPLSLPTLREGVDELERLVAGSGVEGAPVIAVEATGSLHRAWTVELERRFPGCVRLFAPSETQAARTQLGVRRFKSDDRDCAALVWLARQGLGRAPEEPTVEALLGVVRHRRQLVTELTQAARQRDQRQADQARRVFADDAGKQTDSQRFAPESAGAVEGLLGRDVALDLGFRERTKVDGGRIDELQRLIALDLNHCDRGVIGGGRG